MNNDPLFDLFVSFDNDYGATDEAVLHDLTVDEIADFIEVYTEDGATGFGVYPAKDKVYA